MKKIIFMLFIGLTFVACKKRKIEKNLDGEFIATTFVEGSYNYINETTTLELKFSEIKKGEGEVLLTWTSDGNLFTYPGSFTLNDDYSEIEVTSATNNPAQTQLWNGDLFVEKNYISIIGTERLVGQAETEYFSLAANRK